MNLSELRTAVKDRGYDGAPDAMIDRLLNSAYRRIAGQRRWSWLERLDTAQSAIASNPSVSLVGIPALMWVDAVRLEPDTNWRQLEYLPPQELRKLEQRDGTAGRPCYWTEAFGELRLWSRPDAAYTLSIDYITTPTDLVSDADTPLFDSTFHDILVWSACMELAYRQRDSYAAVARENYDARMMEMTRAYSMKQRQTSRQVQSGYWGSRGYGER
jgi:hypothetical protein